RLTEVQHERSEEALRESERWFRTLIERSTDGISVLDGEGRIAYDSPSVARLFGVPPRLGNLGLDIVHPDDVALIEAAHETMSATGSADLEHRIVTPRGVRWVECRLTD